jgi:hypothetical protein
MIFCRAVHVLDGALLKCQHISKRNYEITGTAVILRRSFIYQDYNYKDGPLIFLFPFLKYIIGI